VLYDDLAPFLSKQTIMTSDVNNAATMSLDDFFTKNHYRGTIYKTTNMLGKTLAQYCETDSALTAEQQRIEQELAAFENGLFGSSLKNDTTATDSTEVGTATAAVKPTKEAKKKTKKRRQRVSRETESSTSTSSSQPRVSVRRQRH
jgi:hypothetical protein